ncbi:hypothetical protein MMC10_000311 [Thelotrema lepadinum]|nr:hypothetical protein [Thelotrema lepadinum]
MSSTEVVTSARPRAGTAPVSPTSNSQERDRSSTNTRSSPDLQATTNAVHQDDQDDIQPSISAASEASQHFDSKSPNSPQANLVSCGCQLHHSNTGISRQISPHLMPSTSFMITPQQPTFTNKLVALSTISATIVSLATLGITVWQVLVQKDQQQKPSDSTDSGSGSARRDDRGDPSLEQGEENLDDTNLLNANSLYIAITVCVGMIAFFILGFLMVSIYRASKRRVVEDKPTEDEIEPWPQARPWGTLLSVLAALPPNVSGLTAFMAICNAVLYYLFTPQSYNKLRDEPRHEQESQNTVFDAPVKYFTGLVVCLAFACLLTYASVVSHSERTDRRPSDVAVSALAKIDYHTRARAQQAHEFVRSYHIQLQEAGWHRWRFWATPIPAVVSSEQNIEGEFGDDSSSVESVEEDSPAWEGEIGPAEDDDSDDSPRPEEFRLADTHMTARSALDLGEEEVRRRYHEHERLLRKIETENDWLS